MKDVFNTKGNVIYLTSIVLVAVLGGLLFGYDTAVISGAEKGLQAFFLQAEDFLYTGFWHGFTSSSALIGCIVGSAISGLFATSLGRKRSLFIAGVLFFISALGSYRPDFLFFEYGKPTFALLLSLNVYRIIGGVGIGLASALCPMYIAEIAPARMRGTLVSWNQFAIISGQLLVYFVNFIILGDHTYPLISKIAEGVYSLNVMESDPWTIAFGWRYMFGSEAVPAALFAILIFFVPETPRFLAMNGDDDKALKVLAKINGDEEAKTILAEIKETAQERFEPLFTYGWVVIFVGIMLSVFQQAIGINAVLYYAPRIFDSMGMGDPMKQTVMMGIVNLAFTLVAVLTVERIGRKPLLICGSIGMAMGALGVALSNMIANPGYLPVASIMLYSASFMFSWGPICWVLIAEIFPNTIRGAAMAIAVAFQWVFNFIVSSTFVPMYDMSIPGVDNFGHIFSYALYGIVCIVAAFFVYRMVPETRGKTLEDMVALWKKRK